MLNRARLALLGLVAVIAWGLYLGSVWSRYSSYATDSKSYLGIKLEAPMDEVMYTLGPPQIVLFEPTRVHVRGPLEEWRNDPIVFNVDWKGLPTSMPSSKSVKDYSQWIYKKKGMNYALDFDPKTKLVMKISCTDFNTDTKHTCPDIFGISSRIDEKLVIKRLGNPDRQEYSDGGTKAFFYDGLGTELTLAQNSDYSITKYAPKDESWLWVLWHVWL